MTFLGLNGLQGFRNKRKSNSMEDSCHRGKLFLRHQRIRFFQYSLITFIIFDFRADWVEGTEFCEIYRGIKRISLLKTVTGHSNLLCTQDQIKCKGGGGCPLPFNLRPTLVVNVYLCVLACEWNHPIATKTILFRLSLSIATKTLHVALLNILFRLFLSIFQ